MTPEPKDPVWNHVLFTLILIAAATLLMLASTAYILAAAPWPPYAAVMFWSGPALLLIAGLYAAAVRYARRASNSHG